MSLAVLFFLGGSMNFKFKLSHRLARMKLPALLAGTLVLACKLTSTGPAAGLILGIDITPPRFSLLPSQAANLTVAVINSKADSTALALAQGTLQWSTTGGTVSNNGVLEGVRYMTYSAPAQPGTYLLVVTTTNGWPADTASFTVTATAVPVSGVVVTPGSLSLAAGDTVTLRATLTDQTGAVLVGRPITWSSSDAGVATVLPTGFVRAMTAGSATITAMSEDHTATAVITVNR
jgi:hypothetical protein